MTNTFFQVERIRNTILAEAARGQDRVLSGFVVTTPVPRTVNLRNLQRVSGTCFNVLVGLDQSRATFFQTEFEVEVFVNERGQFFVSAENFQYMYIGA